MKPLKLEDSIRLPWPHAVQRHLDDRNFTVLRRVLLIAGPGSAIAVIALMAEGHRWLALAWGLVLVWSGAIFLGRTAAIFERRFRDVLLIWLGVTSLAIVVSLPAPAAAASFSGFVYPLAFVALRLRLRETVALGALWGATLLWSLNRPGMAAQGGARLALGVVGGLFLIALAALGLELTRRVMARFSREWEEALARETERSRMREELQDARAIQLSMLPTGGPALDWVDWSAASLPATEVGGDFFEHFVLSPLRLAVVIGDVAGHGVASGIVLSGVRSGLYLLRDQLTAPIEVMLRLNGMVRETAPGRMFVTLQIALVDIGEGSIRLVSAGHPPALHVAADGGTQFLGEGGLPLGTQLEPALREVSRPFARGDALLLYSDGLQEVQDLHGENFGARRLVREARRKGGSERAAREIRDGVLNSVSRFKGDVAQGDDLTLVVLKHR